VTTIAVVGLGAMGARIARRLLEAGNELIVWNRDAAKAAPLEALGASQVDTPAEAARRADAVITMVADPIALRDVTEGTSGVAAGADGSTVIQMSTVGIAATARLRSVLPPTAELLDAPVLGSLAEAEAGSLQIFAGGPEPVVDRCAPLLSPLGAVRHVGPVGAGSAAKLVANASLLGVTALLGEALALASGLGLSREIAFDVLAVTPLAAQAERRRPSLESGDYPPRFALSLARKDADLVLEAAAAAGADLRVLAAMRSWYAEAEAAGAGGRDHSAVLARILREGAVD
jgi:3-hydroxyisobutyrate dehydrogenase/2-hydroxy-3-oxopropionate reductase